ncbi:OmpA family protein [Hydrocarboniphaga sp.]|uniref:OmpA family protein n=1 Tax=Hydrocarboniphaga sp. TaxID=2033016 RepID=UPI003D147132
MTKHFKAALLAALAALSVGSIEQAQAQDNAAGEDRAIMRMGRPLYVSPMATYTLADGSRKVDDGVGGSLAVGTRVFNFLAIEASGDYASLDNKDSGGSADISGYGVNALLFPLKSAPINLYLLFGLQYSETKGENFTTPTGGGLLGNAPVTTREDIDGLAFSSGVGLMQPFSVFGLEAAARIQAVYRIDSHERLDSNYGEQYFDDFVFSAGLAFALFPEKKDEPVAPPAEPEAAVVAVADSDGDGVADDADQCPDTPAGSTVDASGCPLPPPAAPCKTPEAGEKLDMSGCATGDVIVLRGVNFDFDKATLTANAKTILDMVADALIAAPSIKVEVGGHTDGRGSDAYNQKLSQRRAEAVKQYLSGRGIAADRLNTAGYGARKPVADNATDEGRELNRRVELKIEG